jgi:preprotein translocase subunit SecE
MAVAETRKMDRPEGEERGSWFQDALDFFPKKFAELKTFFAEVRAELKNVTWPGRQEIYSTTIVVVLTTVFFGFYLYFIDLFLSYLLAHLVKQVS